MAAVPAWTGHLDGVLAAVGGGGVEGDGASLAAVIGVGWPLGLVPAALEVVRYLGEREGQGDSGEES